MSDRPIYIYVATYSDAAAAEADYEMLLDQHAAELVGAYDVALVTRDTEGKLHVDKHEKPRQLGECKGLAVGALVAVVRGTVDAGAAIGGVGIYLENRMSHETAKELGEMLEDGQAALVVIGESRVQEQLDKLLTRAVKTTEKEIEADSMEFKRELEKAEKRLAVH
jgi:uncharacterized membrane protein